MSKNLEDLFFPQFANATWGKLNLNEIATDLGVLLADLIPEGVNPFLDPQICDNWKEFIHKVKEIDYSYGGYLEDRAIAWQGRLYHGSIHVGVDYYVPVDTAVHMPVDGKLIESWQDDDIEGGWGGRLVFQKADGIYIVLAHLKDMVTEVGKVYKAGDKVALIAASDTNGNWSPHLHVQCMKHLKEGFDGYVHDYPGIEKDYPNPEVVLT